MKAIVLILLSFTTSNALAYNFVSPSEPSGQIIMGPASPAKQLFPVFLQQVNDENTNVRSDVVWLSPGKYELTLGAQIDRKYTRALNTPLRINSKNTLNIEIEADKTYYVAFDASSRDIAEWQPVVYKVE